MNQATENGIRTVMRICEEALDHEIGWGDFCDRVNHVIMVENEFVKIHKSECSSEEAGL